MLGTKSMYYSDLEVRIKFNHIRDIHNNDLEVHMKIPRDKSNTYEMKQKRSEQKGVNPNKNQG